MTGRVLGGKEIRVVNEKVSITSMKVEVISGVQLSLFPDTDFDNEFIAETTITSKLSAKYQVHPPSNLKIYGELHKCHKMGSLNFPGGPAGHQTQIFGQCLGQIGRSGEGELCFGS